MADVPESASMHNSSDGRPAGLEQIRRCFAATEMRCADIRAGAGRVLVSEHGGRIFGPFFDDVSLNWVSPLFDDEERFRTQIDEGAWNLGGDRLWLAPELRYNVRDRARFLESYHLQPAVDPGSYCLEESAPERCRLFQVMRLEAYDDPALGPKSLRLERLVQPAGDPLRDVERYETFRERVSFCGYEQIVTLTDIAPDGRESQAWSITQVPPGGVILVPVVPGAEYEDHLEPVDERHLEIHSNHIRVRARGDRKFKIELKAAHHFGRFGYYRKLGGGRASLVVKLFFNNPSASYVMEAPHLPGVRGYSLDIYHDDGGLGGFAEIECHGQPVGYPGGVVRSTDQFLTWAYRGKEAAVRETCAQLLGMSPE